MRKGKFGKSAAVLIVALLTTCVLAPAVLSGENPWDSDQRPKNSAPGGGSGGSDSVAVSTEGSDRSVTTGGSAASSFETGWMQAFHRVIFYIARNFGDRYEPSSKAGQAGGSRSDRW